MAKTPEGGEAAPIPSPAAITAKAAELTSAG
jgi:hypothetical protein